MNPRPFVLGIAAALLFAAPAGYALQEFTLEEAQTRIERLEARVAALEASAVEPGGPIETHEVNGTLSITGADNFFDYEFEGETLCAGYGGYDDIGVGSALRVLDGQGNVIASGKIESGTVKDGILGKECRLPWTIEVPDSDFYEFQIAGRRGPAFSRDDLEDDNWTVGLVLGD